MSDAVPEPKRNMGQPVPRIDSRLKVTGGADYAADEPLHNLAHGVLVTSSIARGRVEELDLGDARAVPGVLDILTYGDAGMLKAPDFGTSASTSIQPLHDRRIWHDGQIVALVVAETFEAAQEAAHLVRVTYAEEEPSATFDSPGTETVDAAEAADSFTGDSKAGDAEQALRDAPVTVDATYGTPTQHHNPIELFSSTCVWNGDKLTLYEPSQNLYAFKNALARQLRMNPDDVRVISRYVGGGFGSKGPMTPRTAIVALAARRLGRPVRCVVTRMQAFTTQTYRAETRHRIRLGASRDGRIAALSHEGWEVTSRPDNYVVGGTDVTSRLYGYGAVLTDVKLVKADRNTPGYMRSPPEVPYVYALESALDELAVALDMDPVELRRVNDTRVAPVGNAPYTSRTLMPCYDAAAEAFGWSQRDRRVGAMRDGDWLVGWGCATAVYPTNVAPASARVRLSADGGVHVQSASQEIGTGIRTVAGQMAAERLGVDFESVSVEMGDTELPAAPVSGGSISTASVCSAVRQACEAIRARLFTAAVTDNAGPFAGHDAQALDLRDGKLVADGASEPLQDAVARLGTGVIEEYAEWAPDGVGDDPFRKLYAGSPPFKGGSSGDKVSFALGAEFVEVRIHARTRELRVPRMVGAFAAGRIMNPRTARSQLMGGMIWGVSSALLEATEIDRRAARYVNRDLAEYLIPVNADVDQVEVIMVPEEDQEVNPAGVKGLGELGNVGTAAAVANAVYHATGRRLRDLPIRLEHLL